MQKINFFMIIFLGISIILIRGELITLADSAMKTRDSMIQTNRIIIKLHRELTKNTKLKIKHEQIILEELR